MRRSDDLDAGLFGIRDKGRKTLLGEDVIGHGLDHRGRGGADIRADLRAFGHVVGGPDRSRENLRFVAVIVIDLADIRDQLQPVEVQVVQPADEGRNEGSA